MPILSTLVCQLVEFTTSANTDTIMKNSAKIISVNSIGDGKFALELEGLDHVLFIGKEWLAKQLAATIGDAPIYANYVQAFVGQELSWEQSRICTAGETYDTWDGEDTFTVGDESKDYLDMYRTGTQASMDVLMKSIQLNELLAKMPAGITPLYDPAKQPTKAANKRKGISVDVSTETSASTEAESADIPDFTTEAVAE